MITITNCVDLINNDVTDALPGAPRGLAFSLMILDENASNDLEQAIYDPSCLHLSPYGAIVGRQFMLPSERRLITIIHSVSTMLPSGWFVVSDRILISKSVDKSPELPILGNQAL